ncbi:MAG: TIGR03936 family radical SAM-associated protein [Syntrophomonadaceae bacterium]|jgi:radical SAM-linked protein
MRIRAEYRVGPELRFLANLDMIHVMERALRRARLPYALSEGFNPHIRLSLGTVLPVGLWGEREYFDLELQADMSSEELINQLNPVLPVGLTVTHCAPIAADAPSIMSLVNAASYAFKVRFQDEAVLKKIEMMMAASQLVVASRGKKKDRPKDLRPGMHKIAMMRQGQFDIIELWVSTGEPINVRFDELTDLLLAMGLPREQIDDVWRSGNYCRSRDHFYTPMEQVKLF